MSIDPKNKVDKFILEAVKKMFSTIGEKYTAEFVLDKTWFQKKQWDVQQEKKFKKWFISTARKRLGWNKALSEKEYSWFNLMWGWSYKDETRTRKQAV